MTLQQLQYLMEVYRTGSVSGAAKHLYLAQSSLSASISSLESELGFPVFIRTKSGMIPTVHGSRVIEQAARICESYRVMLDPPAIIHRHIRISIPEFDPLHKAFAALVASCKDDLSVHFSIDTCDTAAAAKALAAFELDLAILLNHEARILAVDTLLDSMGLKRQKIDIVPAVIQIGPRHRLYNEANVSPKDFRDDYFIDNISDPLVDNDFLKGVIRLSPEKTLSAKNAHLRTTLLEQGLGYTIAAYAKNSPSQLRNIFLPDVNYILSAVTNPKSPPCELTEQYLHFMQNAL